MILKSKLVMPIPDHIQYIIDNYSTELLTRLKGEGRNVTVKNALDTLTACDPTANKSLVDWLVKTYCAGGFRWEDVEIGAASKLAEVLGFYQTHFSQIPREQRNIYMYQSYGELYRLVEPYLPTKNTEEILGSREARRRERARALEESEVLYRSDDMIVAVPLTQNAAVWWGKGTKWCTSAENNNYFDHYNRDAPLIVITLMNQNSDSARNLGFQIGQGLAGKNAEKFQLWINGEDVQFMDSADCKVNKETIEKHWSILEPLIRLVSEYNINIVSYIPDQFKTAEICEKWVDHNGLALRKIPDRFKTFDLCKRAIGQNAMALKDVGENFKTLEFCKYAVGQNGMALNYVPEKFKTPDLCMYAVKQSGQALYYVPYEMRTIDMCMLAIEQSGLSIYYVPEHLQTIELYKLAVEQNGLALADIPTQYKTLEICWQSVEQNGVALESVPQEYRTLELCLCAIQQDSEALCFIPDKFRSAEIYQRAIKFDPQAIRYVPFKDRTPDISRLAVENDPLTLYYILFNHKTPELCRLAVEKNREALKFVPASIRESEFNDFTNYTRKKDWDNKILEDLKKGLDQSMEGLQANKNSSLQKLP